MSEWLFTDYHIDSNGTRVDEPRAIPVRAIDYMEINASSGTVEYAVIGKKRYHPMYQDSADELFDMKSDAKLITEALNSLSEKICATIAEEAEKNTDALYEVSQELDIIGDLLRKSTKKRHKKN